MPTCRDIITLAMRKPRIIGVNKLPTSSEAELGLDELQSVYETWGTNGMFGSLNDTLQTTDYDAKPFDRIQISGGTVTLPTELEDDDEAPPYNLSFIEVIDTDAETVTRYLYENGAWIELGGLTLDDEAPLASRGKAGLSACLAMNIAEAYGATVGPLTARQAAAFRTGLALKNGSTAAYSGPEWF